MVVFNYKLMKVVSEEVCTYGPSMTVIDAEEGAFGPLSAFKVFGFRLHNIQDNGHSVLVVISHDTLVCVGSIT